MGAQLITGVIFGLIEWIWPGSVLPKQWRDKAQKDKPTS